MQKKILLIAVYITLSGVYVIAQNKKQVPPPPPPPVPPTEHMMAPPLPPPPPPPLPDEPALPPVPAMPPTPPDAPAAPLKAVDKAFAGTIELVSPVIINSNGYEISVQKIKEKQVVNLEKDNVLQRIKLSTWNTKRKNYEKRYGQLPPTKIGRMDLV